DEQRFLERAPSHAKVKSWACTTVMNMKDCFSRLKTLPIMLHRYKLEVLDWATSCTKINLRSIPMAMVCPMPVTVSSIRMIVLCWAAAYPACIMVSTLTHHTRTSTLLYLHLEHPALRSTAARTVTCCIPVEDITIIRMY